MTTDNPTTPWDRVDFADPFTYRSEEVHAAWAYLRRHDPVHWCTTKDGLGYWSVTKFDDADRVLRDHVVFTSEHGTLLNLLGKGDPAGGKQMAATDPPAHTQMRAAIQAALSHKAIEVHRERIRARVRELLAPIEDGTAFDFAATMAALPMAVTGTLMDLPAADWARLTWLTWAAVAPDDPEFVGPGGPQATLERAHRELFAYFVGVVMERRKNLRDDLISTLVRHDLAHGQQDHGRVVSNCYSLLLGANVTTPQVPSAALVEMMRTDGIYRQWSSDPALLVRGLDEALRWASPANHFMRYATADVVLRGTTIRKGDAVVAWLGSANRDEEIFADPFTFDVTRRPNKHLAFGIGPHYCVGHTVARVALQELFGELFARFESFEPAGEADHLASNFVAGIKHLPVTATCRAGVSGRALVHG